MNKHIIHHYHKVGFRKQRVVRKNFFIKEAFILNVINSVLINVIVKDAIYNVH